MSVIGRLDGQVDEIIIKPVSARNRTKTDERQPSAQETVRQPQAVADEDRARNAENSEEHSSTLPVWLL